MQVHITQARALGRGQYDFKGPKGEVYSFLDLYDKEAGKVLRLSLGQDCVCPAIPEEGATINVWCEVVQGEKIVRGEDRDRSMVSLKLRAVNVELAKAAAATTANDKQLATAA